MRPVILIFCLLHVSYLLAQIQFLSLPANLQLFPRDKNNFGHFEVKGISAFSAKIRSVVSKKSSGEHIEAFTADVQEGKSFSFQHSIPAMLEEFTLEIFAKDTGNSEHLVRKVNDLLAGDFFIVAGQSNAESVGGYGSLVFDSIYSHPCARALGANFNWATGRSDGHRIKYPLDKDCTFGRPSILVQASGTTAFAGLWPLKLQYNMVQESGVPNCFVNGAIGGSSISENMASHIPSLPDSLRHSSDTSKKLLALPYDRIYKKIHANNANAGVKGVFWYQGETDATHTRDTAEMYGSKFRKLRTSWKADYPNVKKIFVLQLNVGCAGEYLDLIRETQRKFPAEYEDVVIMSTVGSVENEKRDDMCHYTEQGCSRIADNLLPLAKKHIYGFDLNDASILPANILKAYYTRPGQICLEFDKNVTIEDSTLYPVFDSSMVYLKDYFYRTKDESVNVESLGSENNKVFLNLKSSEVIVKKLSYLPRSFTNIPSGYVGPWILNENNSGIGAYAFAEFPVETDLLETVLVYPNPAKNQIEILVKEGEHYSVTLYDIFGHQFRTTHSYLAHSYYNLEAIPTGIYFLKVEHAKGFEIKKIVVE